MSATPGPWTVNTDKRYEGGKPCYVWGPAGPGRGVVCELQAIYPREFNSADAHLIAAAPDLLAACESSLKYLDTVDTDKWPPALDAMLRAAIRKAKGESC